jgi:hypothetical protein
MKIFKRGKYTIYLLIFLIAVFGFLLRMYKLTERTGFDADQEEIAFKAAGILEGHPALLGPKTSVGSFSIGPGFTYLWTVVNFFLKGDPAAGAYLSVLLGVATVAGFYLVGEKLFNRKTGIFLAVVAAFSASTVFWDQGPWAPSLFHLSVLVLIFGAYIATKKPYGIVIASAGFILGFQAHFGIFLCLLACAAFWLFYKPLVKRKYLLASLSVIFLGLLPNIIFDLTHNFANIRRLFGIFGVSNAGFGASIGKVFNTLTFSSLSVFYSDISRPLSIFIFAAVFIFILWRLSKAENDRPKLVLLILMIVIPFLAFIFYRSNFSEYYLTMTIPPFLFLVGYIFYIIPERYKWPVLFLLAVFIFVNTKMVMNYHKVISLSAKEKAVLLVLEKGGKSGYGVSLTTKPGYNFGFDYLFKYYGASPHIPPLKDEKKIFTLSVPDGAYGVVGIEAFDGIGVRWEGI